MLTDQINQAIKMVRQAQTTISVSDVTKYTDLAYLEDKSDEGRLKALCMTAMSKPECSAVCVFLRDVQKCREFLKGSDVKVACVIDFPNGEGDSKVVRREIDDAIIGGSQELDIVFPYRTYIDTKAIAYKNFERVFEHISKRAFTKVIIETGAFSDMEMIYDLTCGLIDMGANMIKTSSGKHANGPTMEVAAAILIGIKNHGIGATTGIKVSGGIRTCQDAAPYARLYQNIISRDWRNRSRLRFGASQIISS